MSEEGDPVLHTAHNLQVMQSDGNTFCGDVVLDSFDMAYRDEDNILYQKYEKQIFWEPIAFPARQLQLILIIIIIAT